MGDGELGFDSGEREPEKWLSHLRKAVGTKITQSEHGQVVTTNNGMGS